MHGNRRLLWGLLFAIIVVLLILGGAYLYLMGGQDGGSEEIGAPASETGIVHVRTIYTYDGDTPIAHPVGAATDTDGNIYVTLRDVARVLKFNADGDFISWWGDRGTAPGQLLTPMGLAVDQLANHVYVTDRARLRLICYDLDGIYLWELPLLSPLTAAVGPDGNVFVSTFGPLLEMSSEGELIGQSGTRGQSEGQFDFPRSLVVGEDGAVFVADTNNTRVQRVQRSGELTAVVDWVLGTPPRFQDDPGGTFIAPSGVALDEAGRLIVLDGFSHVISVVDSDSGEVVHEFEPRNGPADGYFNLPTSIAHIKGDLFVVTDTFNDRLQIIRLLTPEENTFIARSPWIWWFAPGLLLIFLPFFGRRRAFVTEEALTRAIEDGQARVVLAVYPRMAVLGDVYERVKDIEEEGVRLGDHLIALGRTPEADEDPETALFDEARRSALQKVLLARHRLIAVDEDQADRARENGIKGLSYDWVSEHYSLVK